MENGVSEAVAHEEAKLKTPVYRRRRQFAVVATVVQIVFIVLFGVFGKYSNDANPMRNNAVADRHSVLVDYPLFQDIHVMMFVGFGFLMTYLKRYGFSAIGLNLLLAAITAQWGILLRGFISLESDGKFPIGVNELVFGDFTAAVVLITFGCMLGRLSPTEYLVMALVESVFAVYTEHLVVHYLHVNDVGGSMIVHLFGAYFGLAMSRVLYTRVVNHHQNEESVYHSDMYAMIGTLFLWCFWPSFNAFAATTADARHRAIVNTYLSLTCCVMTCFIFSQLIDSKHRFAMDAVQNATLAGGVAVGTAANMALNPFGALLVGFVAGAISVLGYRVIEPWLTDKLKLHDTCGVHNLHGMPAVLAGIVGIIACATADTDHYSTATLWSMFPGMADHNGHHGRTKGEQAGYQAAGLFICWGIAILSGAFTGLIIRFVPVWNQVPDWHLYDDAEYFETPDDFDIITKENTDRGAFERKMTEHELETFKRERSRPSLADDPEKPTFS